LSETQGVVDGAPFEGSTGFLGYLQERAMNEHDDDLEEGVLEDASEEVSAFPNTEDELVSPESANDDDLPLDEDEAEL
jgi:hypothetical protein